MCPRSRPQRRLRRAYRILSAKPEKDRLEPKKHLRKRPNRRRACLRTAARRPPDLRKEPFLQMKPRKLRLKCRSRERLLQTMKQRLKFPRHRQQMTALMSPRHRKKFPAQETLWKMARMSSPEPAMRVL